MRYQVRRRSGTVNSTLRTILDTEDFTAARARYDALAATLRQGTLVLIDTLEERTLSRTSECGKLQRSA